MEQADAGAGGAPGAHPGPGPEAPFGLSATPEEFHEAWRELLTTLGAPCEARAGGPGSTAAVAGGGYAIPDGACRARVAAACFARPGEGFEPEELDALDSLLWDASATPPTAPMPPGLGAAPPPGEAGAALPEDCTALDKDARWHACLVRMVDIAAVDVRAPGQPARVRARQVVGLAGLAPALLAWLGPLQGLPGGGGNGEDGGGAPLTAGLALRFASLLCVDECARRQLLSAGGPPLLRALAWHAARAPPPHGEPGGAAGPDVDASGALRALGLLLDLDLNTAGQASVGHPDADAAAVATAEAAVDGHGGAAAADAAADAAWQAEWAHAYRQLPDNARPDLLAARPSVAANAARHLNALPRSSHSLGAARLLRALINSPRATSMLIATPGVVDALLLTLERTAAAPAAAPAAAHAGDGQALVDDGGGELTEAQEGERTRLAAQIFKLMARPHSCDALVAAAPAAAARLAAVLSGVRARLRAAGGEEAAYPEPCACCGCAPGLQGAVLELEKALARLGHPDGARGELTSSLGLLSTMFGGLMVVEAGGRLVVVDGLGGAGGAGGGRARRQQGRARGRGAWRHG
jgi:hypothetical protein